MKAKIRKAAEIAVALTDIRVLAGLIGVFLGGAGVAFAYSFEAMDKGTEFSLIGNAFGYLSIIGFSFAILYFGLCFIAGMVVNQDMIERDEKPREFGALYSVTVLGMIGCVVIAAHAAQANNDNIVAWSNEIYSFLKLAPAVVTCICGIDVVSVGVELKEEVKKDDNKDRI